MQNIDKLFINGQWVKSQSTESIALVNPSNETVIGKVIAANEDDVNIAVAAARKAFPKWSAVSSTQRSAIIKNIAKGMEKRKAELAQAISTTMGCPEHIASWLQVEDSIYAMSLFSEQTDITEKEVQGNKCIIVKESIGVCAFINPWNFPLHQFVGKVGAALAAGCTMVVKPAEQTPLQDRIMAEILADSDLPDGVFNLVFGTGQVVGNALTSHPDVDMVSFTGSTQAGIKVAQSAAATVKRVTQELGGKSPLIITEEADLSEAIKYGVEDVMLNSGQNCNTLSRMLIPQSKYQEAIEISVKIAEELKIGIVEGSFLGPMSSKAQQQRVLDYIQIGIDEGAELICGGIEPPENLPIGYYVKPTIFANVDNKMRIAQEEIFGPVLCLIPYADIESAIEMANDTPYGLSSAVFAQDDKTAIKIAKQIRAGQCMINGGVFNYHAPFGGYKQSGNGREFTHIGVEEFLETKAIITTE